MMRSCIRIRCHFLCRLFPKLRPSPARALWTRASSERFSIELVTVEDGGMRAGAGAERLTAAGEGGRRNGVDALVAGSLSLESWDGLLREELLLRSLFGVGPEEPRAAGLFGDAREVRAWPLRPIFSLRSLSAPLPWDFLVSLPDPEDLWLSA